MSPSGAARRPVESYLRVVVNIPGGSIEAGLQRRRGEPLSLRRAELRRVLEEEALILNGDDLDEDNGQRMTDRLEARLAVIWPEHAWFVELWLEHTEPPPPWWRFWARWRWRSYEPLSQVYAPWGMPVEDSLADRDIKPDNVIIDPPASRSTTF